MTRTTFNDASEALRRIVLEHGNEQPQRADGTGAMRTNETAAQMLLAETGWSWQEYCAEHHEQVTAAFNKTAEGIE